MTSSRLKTASRLEAPSRGRNTLYYLNFRFQIRKNRFRLNGSWAIQAIWRPMEDQSLDFRLS